MDKEFDKSVGEERDRFVIAVREQEWNAKLRTAAENILVMYDQMREKLAAPPLREQPLREASFQNRVNDWMQVCFGAEISSDVTERNHRFIEESLELVQSNGITKNECHQLVDYVFGRPKGETFQEVGGVIVTLAALCNAIGLSIDDAGETELKRIWTKVDKIREKQANKPRHSPLPEATRTALEGDGVTEQEIKNIEAMADETCRLANIERRLIKEAAILIDRYRMAAPAKDLGFTKARCEKWMIEYNELQPHLKNNI